jgi:hypothetical protein
LILPAYGEIPVRPEYMGPALRMATRIETLKPMNEPSSMLPAPKVNLLSDYMFVPGEERTRFTLVLDWYPPADKTGIEQLSKVISEAGKLGYSQVAFNMPKELSYKLLRDSFDVDGRIVDRCGKSAIIGVVKTVRKEKSKFPNDLFFGKLELGIIAPSEADPIEFRGKSNRAKITKDKFVTAVGFDGIGFADRLSFAAEDPSMLVHGAWIIPVAERSSTEVKKLMGSALNVVRSFANGNLNLDKIESAYSSFAEEIKAIFAYATTFEERTKVQEEFEGIGRWQ